MSDMTWLFCRCLFLFCCILSCYPLNLMNYNGNGVCRLNIFVKLKCLSLSGPSFPASVQVGSTKHNALSIEPTKDSKESSLSSYQNLYLLLTCLFVTCLVTSNILDAKLFSLRVPFFGEVVNTAGMITFPFTFIIGDIINEFYGSKATKCTVYVGLTMSIFVFVVISIGQWLPYLDRPYNVSKESFDMIFGCARGVFAASVTSFLVSSLLDIWLFKLIKHFTKGKHLWLRAYGSTAVSQLVDTTLMAYLTYSLDKRMTDQPAASLQEVWQLSSTGYCIKLLMAAVLTPLLYVAKRLINTKES